MAYKENLAPAMKSLLKIIEKGNYGSYDMDCYRKSYNLVVRIINPDMKVCRERMIRLRNRTKNYVILSLYPVKRIGKSFCGTIRYFVYRDPKYRKRVYLCKNVNYLGRRVLETNVPGSFRWESVSIKGC